jgi:hypothetical protein
MNEEEVYRMNEESKRNVRKEKIIIDKGED